MRVWSASRARFTKAISEAFPYNASHQVREKSLMRRRLKLHFLVLGLIAVICCVPEEGFAQPQQSVASANTARSGPGKPVTIPLTIKKEKQADVELQGIDLTVTEDGEPQTIVSVRGVGTNSPITLALLIQEDLVPSVSNEIRSLADFVRKLPKGSRVMIGYLRTGSLLTKQKFTADLDKAASALRPPAGFANTGPYNPYVEVVEALN